MCVGGFHLDGNLPSRADRMQLLPAALLRACGRSGPPDVALFAGDMNCTLDPEKPGAEATECGPLISGQIRSLRASGGKNGLEELSKESGDFLQLALASSATRAVLMEALDGTPPGLRVEPSSLSKDESWSAEREPESTMTSCTISELLVQPTAPGSFPTYHFTNCNGKGFAALKQSSRQDDDEIQLLQPDLDVSRECISECYFGDEKAGVLKKRGDMIRLNMGWLDRLYYGVSRVEGSPAFDLHIEQRTPLVLTSMEGMTLDHALVAWRVSIHKNALPT